jgi:hypothetical protein
VTTVLPPTVVAAWLNGKLLVAPVLQFWTLLKEFGLNSARHVMGLVRKEL